MDWRYLFQPHKVVVRLKLDNPHKVLITVTSVLKYFGTKCLTMSGIHCMILAFHLWLFRRNVCHQGRGSFSFSLLP